MHDLHKIPRSRALACLVIDLGSVVVEGGLGLEDSRCGYFIPRSAADLRPIPNGQQVRVRMATGETVEVRDVAIAPSTSGLPSRYVFTYMQEERSPRM
jgi:hypothetical protein